MRDRLTKKSEIFPNEYRIIFKSGHSTLEDTTAVVNKLGEYEDAEEIGELVKLPCKVGVTINQFNWVDDEIKIVSARVTCVRYSSKTGITINAPEKFHPIKCN